MIKTLRITSILAAIAAAVLIKYFVFPMVVGAGGDERVDKILDGPTVVEKFRATKGADAKGAGPDVSPLVKQATVFARYLMPKQPVRPGPSRGPGVTTAAPPRAVSPKFKVFATTYFEGNPSLSQALIDEPGRERRWVRQASMVGGLFIEQVKDGVVVVKSSKDTYELAVEGNSQAAPVKRTSPTSTVSRPATGQSITQRPSPSSVRAASDMSRTPDKPPLQQSSAIPSEKATKLIQSLESLQKKTQAPEDRARIADLISRFQPADASAADAQSAKEPGEDVEGGAADPNRSSSLIKGGKIGTGSAKAAPSSSK